MITKMVKFLIIFNCIGLLTATTPQIKSTTSSIPKFSSNIKIDGTTVQLKVTGKLSPVTSSILWSDYQLIKRWGYKDVLIYVNSSGGNAFTGLSMSYMLETMKRGGINIKVEGHGIVASAAVPIFVSGSERVCSEGTMFLIHPLKLKKMFTEEELKDLESQAEMMEKLNDSYATIISKNTKLTKDKVLEMLKSDNWINSRQALQYGIIDRIE